MPAGQVRLQVPLEHARDPLPSGSDGHTVQDEVPQEFGSVSDAQGPFPHACVPAEHWQRFWLQLVLAAVHCGLVAQQTWLARPQGLQNEPW